MRLSWRRRSTATRSPGSRGNSGRHRSPTWCSVDGPHPSIRRISQPWDSLGVLYANAALQAAIHGIREVLGELKRSGNLDAVEDRIASFKERQRLVGMDAFGILEKRYASRSGRDSAAQA